MERTVELEGAVDGASVEPGQTLEAQVQQNFEVNESIVVASTDYNCQFQRGDMVIAWVKERWVSATYIRPIDNLILSHRTRKLDEGHQIFLPGSPLSFLPHRIAASDLRPLLNPEYRMDEVL
jgi:hypothetical protein